jgi:CheY-like chemotaxis protein
VLLGRFIAESEERIARRAAKALKHELEEAPSRTHRYSAIPSYAGELASLLLERGEDAPRLWGEAVRHHGGAHFEMRKPVGDLVREFKSLFQATYEEWERRKGPMPAEIAALLAECMAEGSAAAVSDYVRRLRSEQAEFRESALIQTILEHLDVGILLIEKDGTLSLATRPALELFGDGLGNAIGRPIADPALGELFEELGARTLEGESIELSRLPAIEALRTAGKAEPLLMRIGQGEAERVIETGAIPVWEEELPGEERKELRGVIATARDRTADVRRTEELNEANRSRSELQTRLLHRSRSQAMGELAAGASHALNNLLNAMHLRLRLLREAPGPEKVEALERSVNDIALLVSRLQQFVSVRAAGAAQPVDLDSQVREALALVRPEGLRAGEKAIRVETRLGARLPVRAHPGELRELLVSLLLYLRDQLAQGGEMEISSRLAARDSVELRIAARPRQPQEYLSPEALLEPFLSGDRAPPLSMAATSARQVLGRWGGALEASADPSGGVDLKLSFAAAQTGAPVAPPAPKTPREGRGRVVLVVDDDPDNASMLAEVLAAEGHVTDTATTGEEAIAKWRKGPFDVALVDLLMPDMAGSEIASALVQIRPEARIALVTGWELDDEQRLRVPIAAVFRKPVNLGELLAFLSQEGPQPAGAAPP